MATLKKIKTLQIVLKTAERCNISCTYCYYFFGGDTSYKQRPGLISQNSVKEIARFLKQGCIDLEIPNLLISFHGGEPTMQKAIEFRQTCEIFISTLANVVSLGFTIQTNGTLLSDEWIQALIDYNVDVGVSIDGPAIYNDMYRIDKKGKGTHAAVVDGIGKLNAKFKQGQLRPISQISVINAHFNYYTVLKHLLTELSINRLSFLLPDINYDTGFPDKHTSETYGKIFCNIFDLWSESGDFEVRQVEEILRFFKNTVVSDTNRNDNNVVYENDYQILVIQSDATVALNDSWLTSLEWQQKVAKPHVTKISLKEYLGKPIFEEIREIYKTKPLECKSCKWLSVCGGGD
jgi:uncharacterized protein